MSRNSPQPKVQTRAKRARIQSQRPLSPESTLIPPSPINKPLEASSVPTTSGFTVFKIKRGRLQSFQDFNFLFMDYVNLNLIVRYSH